MKTQSNTTALLAFLLWNTLLNNMYQSMKSSMPFKIPRGNIFNAPDPDVGELIVAVIGAFVVILVGVNLVGPTATTVGGAIKSGNVTAISGLVSILQVTVLIFGIIVLVAAVVFIQAISNKARQL